MSALSRPGDQPLADAVAYQLLAAGGALAALVLVPLWVAAQAIALVFAHRGVHLGLSQLVGVVSGLWSHPGHPAAAYPSGERAGLPGPLGCYAVGGLALLGVLALLWRLAVLGLALHNRWRQGSPVRAMAEAERDRAASLGWAQRPREVAELVVREPAGDRVVLGRLRGALLAAPPRRSVAVVAPTGSGKTPRLVIPTVLTWPGPALVTSVKGDALYLTVDARRRRGPVWVFDPSGATRETGCRWSPLTACADYAGALATAAWLADSSKTEDRGVEHAAYWDTLGQRLLAPMLYAAAATGAHMAQVVRWVDYAAEEEVQAVLDTLGEPDALAAWAACRAREPRTKSSVYGTAEVIMHSFGHPRIRAALAALPGDTDAFDPAALLDRGGTLYLVAPADDQRLFSPVFEALTNCVVREVERRSARLGGPVHPRLLLMLDEAANIAPLRRLDAIASAGAGQGIVLVSVWQDEGQIAAIYGPARARTVIANHTARMFLPGSSDMETLDGLSRLIGDHRVARTSISRDHEGRRSANESLTEERLAPPGWLRQLPTGDAVVVVGRHKPLRIATRSWYAEPNLRAMVGARAAAEADALYAGERRKGLRGRTNSARASGDPGRLLHGGDCEEQRPLTHEERT